MRNQTYSPNPLAISESALAIWPRWWNGLPPARHLLLFSKTQPETLRSSKRRSSQPIHLTTTTLVTLIFRISSTSGNGVRSETVWPDLFPPCLGPQGRRACRDSLSPRRQGRRRAVLHGGHGQGASQHARLGHRRLPGDDLLRFQAIRNREGGSDLARDGPPSSRQCSKQGT